MRFVRIAAWVLGVYVVLGLVLDSAIGYYQPQSEGTAVLRSFDADGQAHDTVLSLLDDGGTLWVESGHWFRGWYYRVRANPDVETDPRRGGRRLPGSAFGHARGRGASDATDGQGLRRRLLRGSHDAALGADQAGAPGSEGAGRVAA